jgi:chaperonin GroES
MSTPKIQPIAGRGLIRRAAAETKSKGGILMPDSAQRRPLEGVVVAVGPGIELGSGARVPVGVEPGERVVFLEHPIHRADPNDDSLVFIRGEHILGVLEDGTR